MNNPQNDIKDVQGRLIQAIDSVKPATITELDVLNLVNSLEIPQQIDLYYILCMSFQYGRQKGITDLRTK